MPAITLRSTSGRPVNLASLNSPRTIIYCYPMTGVPGQALPDGWDAIPGARGCTPQACNFRDRFDELTALDSQVFGFSTQTSEYQHEVAHRIQLPFELLSDARYEVCDALKLPMFEAGGMRLVKRLTMILRSGRIEHVLYPVFPSNESADQVLRWMRAHPLS